MKNNILQLEVKTRERGKKQIGKILIPSKLHGNISLQTENWKTQIKVHHPEMTAAHLAEVLADPDKVFTPEKHSRVFFYQKMLPQGEFRVVVRSEPEFSQVQTAYPICRTANLDWEERFLYYNKEDLNQWEAAMQQEHALFLTVPAQYA